MGSVAKSYIRKGFLMYEEIRKYCIYPYMRRPLVIYDLQSISSEFPYMRKIFIFSFIGVPSDFQSTLQNVTKASGNNFL